MRPIRTQVLAAIQATVDSGWFLRGPQTRAFEEEWADYCGQAHAVCCNSGTDALTLAATALGLREVEIQANTLPLTGTGLHRAGADVHLVDVNGDGNLGAVTSRSVPVLLFGRLPAADIQQARLFDAAHAHGWRPPAHACAAWSFYPTKTLGALGDGGAVTTNDRAIAEELRALCGRDDRLRDRRQLTSRMDEIQAAVLRIKLRHLDRWLEQRSEIAQSYDERLRSLHITLEQPGLNHLYVVRVRGRDALAAHLADHGIETKIHWPLGLHRQDGPWRRTDSAFPNTEAWSDEILSLPCFPGLTQGEIGQVCDQIEHWFSSMRQPVAKGPSSRPLRGPGP